MNGRPPPLPAPLPVDCSATKAGQRTLLVTGTDPAHTAAALERLWALGAVVGLAAPHEQELLERALRPGEMPLPQWGPAVVVGSGGSSGGRRWCLQPLAHLEASARATGQWLAGIGIDPAATIHLDPLPLHHVSGLLPLVRARVWGGDVRWLPSALMRQPEALAVAQPLPPNRPVLLSLVPTQLARLLASPAGVGWLRQCAVVWVGGAALPLDLARRARNEGIRLSPCYGATETAAMVTALPPERFLAGVNGCGAPLTGVSVRVGADGAERPGGAIEVRTDRLSPGWYVAGALVPLLTGGDWWSSGDGGHLGAEGLEIRGRLDGAINSGGETVFPEQVEERLCQLAHEEGLPLAALLLLPVADPLWGERLVALVRPASAGDGQKLIVELERLARTFSPALRPWHWRLAHELAPNERGKWDRAHWRQWWLQHSLDPSSDLSKEVVA